MVDAGALVGKPLLTLLQTFHDTRLSTPSVIAAPIVAASIALPAAELVAQIGEAIARGLRLVAHGIGEIVPHALLSGGDAQPLMQEIEAALEWAAATIAQSTIAPVWLSAIAPIELAVLLRGLRAVLRGRFSLRRNCGQIAWPRLRSKRSGAHRKTQRYANPERRKDAPRIFSVHGFTPWCTARILTVAETPLRRRSILQAKLLLQIKKTLRGGNPILKAVL
jgi:hypothetical protein